MFAMTAIVCAGIISSQAAETRFVPVLDAGKLGPGMACTIDRACFVAADFTASDQLRTYTLARDRVGIRKLHEAGRITTVRDYTSARVIEVRNLDTIGRGVHVRVRITEGPLKDREVHVLLSMIGTMQPKSGGRD